MAIEHRQLELLCLNDGNCTAAQMATLGISGASREMGGRFVIHKPNGPSGGQLSHVDLANFLSRGNGPEQQALLRLIATLVDVPPYA